MRLWPFPLRKKSIAPAEIETLVRGAPISRAEVLRVPVVANAVQIISEAVASLDVMVKRIEGTSEVDLPATRCCPFCATRPASG